MEKKYKGLWIAIVIIIVTLLSVLAILIIQLFTPAPTPQTQTNTVDPAVTSIPMITVEILPAKDPNSGSSTIKVEIE